MDPRVEKLASVLVNHCLDVAPEEWVAIVAQVPGEPLAIACTGAVLEAGGHPTVELASEVVHETVLRDGNDAQLQFVSPFTRLRWEQAGANIQIRAPQNSRSLSSVDPSRMALENKAQEPLLEIYMRRFIAEPGNLVITEYPTHSAAQDAGMSLRQYEDFVFRAMLLTEPDPVAAWRLQGERQQRLVDWLQDKSEVHVTGPGTDLRLNVAGRTWINDDGHLNFPGGEVFTSPHEDSVEGVVTFNVPGFYQFREVTGVRLRYEGGKVVDADASGNEEFLQEMLGVDEGARRLGEFAFGTNPNIRQVTHNVLFDEKIGGTLHMALGAAYPETGGTNTSALHWDIVYDLRNGAEVTIDGQAFYRDGEIAV